MPKGDEINFGKVSFHSHPIRWDNERPDDGQSNYKEHLRNGPGWECQSPKMKVDTSWFQWTFHNIIEVKFNFRNLCVGSLLGSSSSSSAGCPIFCWNNNYITYNSRWAVYWQLSSKRETQREEVKTRTQLTEQVLQSATSSFACPVHRQRSSRGTANSEDEVCVWMDQVLL